MVPSATGFPGGSEVETLSANPEDAGDAHLICKLGRSPRGENDNPLQHSCLENSMDREAWQTTVHRVTKNWTRLSDRAPLHI